MNIRKIIIIGAGLVGTVCALYFAKRGYEVTIFERRPDPRKKQAERGRSINLALSHRGIKALEEVDVCKKVLTEAMPMLGRCVHDINKPVNFQPYSFHEHEFNYSVSRQRLNQQLLDQLETHKNVKIYFEKLINLSDINNFPPEIKVIVADGASSHIRKALKTNFSETDSDHSYKELTIAAEHAKDLQNNYLHIWPRQEFMLIALPNFDGSFTCTLFMPTVIFGKLTTDKKILKFFQENFAEVVDVIPNLVEQFKQNPVGALKTIELEPWYVNNQLLFIGDAAHAMLPFLGQGMNCGFEDCRLLNELLDRFKDDTHQAFAEFSRTRKIDTDAISKLSLENYLEMRQKVTDPEYLKKRAHEQELVKKFPEKYRPIYELISYTDMPYSEILRLKML